MAGVGVEPSLTPSIDSGSGRRMKKKRNVLSRMLAMSGPLARLEQSRVSGERVSVFIRSVCDVCAICQGQVLVFDRHWNLVMCEVTETYIPRLLLYPHLKRAEMRRRTPIPGATWEDRDDVVVIDETESGSGSRAEIPTRVRSSLRIQARSQPALADTRTSTQGLSLSPALASKSRYYKHLMVRGDNIAFISLAT